MNARLAHESDPERRDRQAHANELMLAVAARLLGEARLTGAFPAGGRSLADFAAELSAELADGEHVVAGPDERSDLPRSDFKVTLVDQEPESVGISCWYGDRGVHGSLRIDGVLDGRGYSVGIRFDDPAGRVELPPLEQEVMKRAFERQKEADGRVAFRGEEFLRALPVEPQPGAAAQILAVELYGDGLVVHYTYDDPVEVRPRVPLNLYELADIEPPIEELRAEAEALGGTLRPNISVRDDVGTVYFVAFVGEGGVDVRHGVSRFTPAVPAGATRLIVTSYAGTIELRL